MKKFQRVLNVILSLAIVLGSCLIIPSVSANAATGTVDGTADGSQIHITFDTNLNGVENRILTFNSGETISSKKWTDSYRDGYFYEGFTRSGETVKIEGWYSDSGLKNKVNFDNETATETKTYYAKWMPNDDAKLATESFSNYNFKGTNNNSALLNAKIYDNNTKSLIDKLEDVDNDEGSKSIWIGDTLNTIDTDTYSSYTISAKTKTDVLYLTATDDAAMEGAIKTLLSYVESAGGKENLKFSPQLHVTQKYYPGNDGYSYTWGDEFTEFDRTMWGDYDQIKATPTRLYTSTGTLLEDGYRSLRTSGVEVVDGNLVLKTGVSLLDHEPEYFYGRQISTYRSTGNENARLTYKYGVMEIRAKLPKTPASADFWFLGEDFEFDLLEAIEEETGVDNNHMFAANMHAQRTGESNTWYSLDNSSKYSDQTLLNNIKEAKRYRSGSVDLSADYHVYSFYWTKDAVKYCVDGIEFFTFDITTGKVTSDNGTFQSCISGDMAVQYFRKEINNFVISATMNAAADTTDSVKPYGPQWQSGDTTETELMLDYVRLYQKTADNGTMVTATPRTATSVALEDNEHNKFLGTGTDAPIETDATKDERFDICDLFHLRASKIGNANASEIGKFDYNGDGEISYDDYTILRKELLGQTFDKDSVVDPLYHIDFATKSKANSVNNWTVMKATESANVVSNLSTITNNNGYLRIGDQYKNLTNIADAKYRRCIAFYNRDKTKNPAYASTLAASNYTTLMPGNYIMEFDYRITDIPTGVTSGTPYIQLADHREKSGPTDFETNTDSISWNSKNASATSLTGNIITSSLKSSGDNIWHHTSVAFTLDKQHDMIGLWCANIYYVFDIDNIKFYKVADTNEYTATVNDTVDGVKLGSGYFNQEKNKIYTTIPNDPKSYKGEPRTLPFNDGTIWREFEPGKTYTISMYYRYDRTSFSTDGATFNNYQATDSYDWDNNWYVHLVYNFAKVDPNNANNGFNPRYPEESDIQSYAADFGETLVDLLGGPNSLSVGNGHENLDDTIWKRIETTFTLPADAETNYIGIRVNHATARFYFSNIEITTSVPQTHATFRASTGNINIPINNENKVTTPNPADTANEVKWQLDGTDEIYAPNTVVDLTGKVSTTFSPVYGAASFTIDDAANFYGQANQLGGSGIARDYADSSQTTRNNYLTFSARADSDKQFILNNNYISDYTGRHKAATYTKDATYRISFKYKYKNDNGATGDLKIYAAFGINRDMRYTQNLGQATPVVNDLTTYCSNYAIQKTELLTITSADVGDWKEAAFIVTAPDTYINTINGVDYLSPYVGLGMYKTTSNGDAEAYIDEITLTPVVAPSIVDYVAHAENSYTAIAGYNYGESTNTFSTLVIGADDYNVIKRGIIFGSQGATKDELIAKYGSYIATYETDGTTELYDVDTDKKIAKYAVAVNNITSTKLDIEFVALPYLIIDVGGKQVTVYGEISAMSYNNLVK